MRNGFGINENKKLNKFKLIQECNKLEYKAIEKMLDYSDSQKKIFDTHTKEFIKVITSKKELEKLEEIREEIMNHREVILN